MTFGWGVEDDETSSAVLERNLNVLAENLSSALYGNIINKKEAKELIDV